MMTPELIGALKQAYPDFYSLKSGVTDTDEYVAANYYLGMLVWEMERIEILNALAQEQNVIKELCILMGTGVPYFVSSVFRS